MLELEIYDAEWFDEETQEFVYVKGGVFRFEHSLKAIRKWESKYLVPFFDRTLNDEELLDYCLFMALDDSSNGPLTRHHLTEDVVKTLATYMETPFSATQITSLDKVASRRASVVTAEVVYAMMSATNVPYSCEDWHIHNLMMLLGVIAAQQGEKKSMPMGEVYAQNAKINAERKARLNTRG